MKKDESVFDDNLEKMGFIKEIDTLKLIEKVEKSSRRKLLILQDCAYAFVAFIIIMFEIITTVKLGIAAVILLNFLIVLPAPILILVKPIKIYGKDNDVR